MNAKSHGKFRLIDGIMKFVGEVALWSLIGAIAAGTLTFAGFLVMDHEEMFAASGETRGWAWFGVEIISAGAAAIGLVVGGIVGTVRHVGANRNARDLAD